MADQTHLKFHPAGLLVASRVQSVRFPGKNRLWMGTAVVLCSLFLLACDDRTSTTDDVGAETASTPLIEVIRSQTDSLMSLDGVIGVAEGRCATEECIVVLVTSSTPAVESLPRELGGYPVQIQQTGSVTAPPGDRE